MASLFCDSDNGSAEVSIDRKKSDSRRSSSSMVAEVMARNEDIAMDRIYPAPRRNSHSSMNPEEEEKEGVMKIIRANIKRITEEANKIDFDRIKRSQIQHFNRFGCFSC